MRNTRTGDGRTLRQHLWRHAYDAFGFTCLVGLAVYDVAAFFAMLAVIVAFRELLVVVAASMFREDDRVRAHCGYTSYVQYRTERRRAAIERIEI